MDIKKFLKKHNLEPKSKYDQYFLKNEEILNLEIDLADLKKDDIVLEIGAGFGNLTEKIAKKAKVIAVEKDPRFIKFLEKIKNVKVKYGDALNILDKKKLNFNKIISNIPYSLSQKLLLKFLKRKWEKAVLIVQKEFAEKMRKDTKLSLLIDDCCEMKIEGTVPDQAFYPKAITSALVVLKQKKEMDIGFWKFLKQMFRYNNKNVKNALDYLNIDYTPQKSIQQKKVQKLSKK